MSLLRSARRSPEGRGREGRRREAPPNYLRELAEKIVSSRRYMLASPDGAGHYLFDIQHGDLVRFVRPGGKPFNINPGWAVSGLDRIGSCNCEACRAKRGYGELIPTLMVVLAAIFSGVKFYELRCGQHILSVRGPE